MRALALLALALGSCAAVRGSSDAAHVIWLDHPAEHFTSALPLGNGTMGALVFGGVDRERIVLNENSYWSGSVEDPNRADAHEYLPQIQKLLLEGKNLEAEALLSQHFTCAGAGSGQGNGANVPYGCYQKLTELLVTHDGTPDLRIWHRAPLGTTPFEKLDESTWARVGWPALSVASNESALYRCRFFVSADVAARAASLDFSPIDDKGEIWLNSSPLGETSDYSRSYSFDCRGKLRAGDNELTVRVTNFGGEGQMAHSVSLRTNGSEYRNELDLRTGIVRTTYTRDGVHYERECFVSKAHGAFVERIRCDKPGAIDCELAFPNGPNNFYVDDDGRFVLAMAHSLPGGLPDVGGITGSVAFEVEARGGSVDRGHCKLVVEHADEIVIRLCSATDFPEHFPTASTPPSSPRTKDALEQAIEKLKRVATIPYDELRRAHVEEHRKLYDRCALELESPAEVLAIPTDKRLERLEKGGEDPALAALDFHYGRYLLMSSSRPGGLPANLQGLWAEETQTPWNGDYHLDINVQMNYWPAEVANLADCHEPLFDLVDSLRKPGAATAKAYYDAPGWVAHVITNVWGFTAPGEDASWGSTMSGGAWLADHLWEHYDFGRDKKFLARVYPAMKESAQFYRAILIEERKHHWLVTAPSNSPEHGYVLPDGRVGHTCMGPTIDQELVRELFGDVIESSRILGVDAELRADLEDARARLAPVQVGAAGDVQEWLDDYADSEPHHRHVSHLYALYPGEEIADDARLREAAKKTLELRGDEGTGWSLAWKIAFWARLGDGEHALKLWKTLMRPVVEHGIVMGHGGTYPNLFCAHPPFQIDGNFGACAGIAEMLLQSQGGVVRLLPALPKEWSAGSVRGLRARGGFEVDLEWSGGKLRRAKVKASVAGPLVLEFQGERIDRQLKSGEAFELVR